MSNICAKLFSDEPKEKLVTYLQFHVLSLPGTKFQFDAWPSIVFEVRERCILGHESIAAPHEMVNVSELPRRE
jgi:hypothetical protein